MPPKNYYNLYPIRNTNKILPTGLGTTYWPWNEYHLLSKVGKPIVQIMVAQPRLVRVDRATKKRWDDQCAQRVSAALR